jgi:hypothetical protein
MWQAYGGVSRHACNVSEFVNGPHALHKLNHARSIDQMIKSYYIILYPFYAHMDTARIDFFVSSCKNTHTN